MSDAAYRAMVQVLVERRNRHPTTKPQPRRKRPSTIQSIRSLLVDDHYALLSQGRY